MQLGVDLLQGRQRRDADAAIWMPGLFRKRLLGYADSMMELSRELGAVVLSKEDDRQRILEEHIYADNRILLSDSLNTVADLMGKIASEISICKPLEYRKMRLVSAILKEEGIILRDAYYIPDIRGKWRISLLMGAKPRNQIRAQEVAEMLSPIFRRSLKSCVTNPERIDEEEKVYSFVEEAPYLVLTGFSRVTRGSEKISGDNYSVIEPVDGKLEILLSDGTGSGQEAFENSGKVIELMEKMLETGYDRDTAVDMLNMTFYAMEQEKNHPTLDLCSLDLYDAGCELRKAGASATFVKRGMDVEILTGTSLPLGVTRKAELAHIHRQLRNGDFIVMMTDGALDALNEHEYEDTMQKIIRTVTEQNPEGIAERILQTVLCLDGGRIRDDMTVFVAGLWTKGS